VDRSASPSRRQIRLTLNGAGKDDGVNLITAVATDGGGSGRRPVANGAPPHRVAAMGRRTFRTSSWGNERLRTVVGGHLRRAAAAHAALRLPDVPKSEG
jgi:hypothetical protein